MTAKSEGRRSDYNPLAIIGDVIAELARCAITIGTDADDNLVLDGNTDRLDDVLYGRVVACATLLRWHVAGRPGHLWAHCDTCGLATMVKKGTKPPCRLTPKCDGHHRPPKNVTAERAAAVMSEPVPLTRARGQPRRSRRTSSARRSTGDALPQPMGAP